MDFSLQNDGPPLRSIKQRSKTSKLGLKENDDKSLLNDFTLEKNHHIWRKLETGCSEVAQLQSI
jgi:hypothetical protein